jgi:hypothetical protein
MGAELDRSDVDLLFEDIKTVGSKVIEYLAIDFWSISVEEAPIAKGTLRGSIHAESMMI